MTDESARITAVSAGGRTGYLVTSAGHSELFEVTDTRILQRHFGPVLTDRDAAALLAQPEPRRAGHGTPDDFANVMAAYGAVLPVEPLVRAVSAADGSHALHLQVTGVGGIDPDGRHLVVSLADPAGLVVEAHWRVASGSAVVERWTVLRNEGAAAVDVGRALSGAVVLPDQPAYRRTAPWGRWAAESRIERTPVPHGLSVQRGSDGIRSFLPAWVMIDDGTATEATGSVHSVVLAWGGNPYLATERAANSRVRISTGIDDADLRIRLEPGATFETPLQCSMWSGAGFGTTSRQWHRYVRDRVLPRTGDRPVLYNSWESTFFDVSEAGQRALAQRAARTGVDVFVMDDGWFGARNDDHAGLGDWAVNPVKFPAGLGPLIEEVERLGMRFGLWVEPEMVNPDSELYRAHPDWVIAIDGRPRTEVRNQLVLNFGRADVRAWAVDWLDTLLRDNRIAFVKWDCNRGVTEPGWAGNANPELVAVEHVRGVYAVFAEIRSRHPGVEFEICSGGGGRVALDFMRYGEQVWTSDNTGAVERLSIQEGYSYVFPSVAMGAWVTDADDVSLHRNEPIGYRFAVAMQGALALGGNLTDWTDAQLAAAAEWVVLHKRLRTTIQHGDRHRVESITDGIASVTGFVSPDRSHAVVVAAGVGEWLDLRERTVRAPGLAADADYHVRTYLPGRDDRPEHTDGPPITGRVAGVRGVTIPWRQYYPAVVVELTRADDPS
jgi:alpha-galactosidase